jgi:SOS response regulatory protein OraA/RecX
MSAFITVTDAAGRVLFRRPATEAEVREAVHAATIAEIESEAALARLYAEQAAMDDREFGQA